MWLSAVVVGVLSVPLPHTHTHLLGAKNGVCISFVFNHAACRAVVP